MLFRRVTLAKIEQGEVSLAFRRWVRPTVRAGGTLLTPIGELEIISVRQVHADSITGADARRAGDPSRQSLLDELNLKAEGEIFRVELGRLQPDPRIALRNSIPELDDLQDLQLRLERMDSRSRSTAWTKNVLSIIKAQPNVRAGDLCELVNQPMKKFKLNVRKLKGLGLIESLPVGYRLSPRGETLLDYLNSIEA
jgi:hypothetical protein